MSQVQSNLWDQSTTHAIVQFISSFYSLGGKASVLFSYMDWLSISLLDRSSLDSPSSFAFHQFSWSALVIFSVISHMSTFFVFLKHIDITFCRMLHYTDIGWLQIGNLSIYIKGELFFGTHIILNHHNRILNPLSCRLKPGTKLFQCRRHFALI